MNDTVERRSRGGAEASIVSVTGNPEVAVAVAS
jgi:hypothetical protein